MGLPIQQAFAQDCRKKAGLVGRCSDFFNARQIRTDLESRLTAAPFLQDGWELTQTPNGRTCVIARAEKPKATIALITGFKSTPFANPKIINFLVSRDISVIGLGLPFPRKDNRPAHLYMKEFLADAGDSVQSFLYDGKSPFYQDFDNDPHFVAAHSTGSLLTLAAALRTPRGLEGKVKETYNVGTFINMANASNLLTKTLFNVNAILNFDVETNRTIAGRLYDAFLNPHDDRERGYLYTPSPTPREILTLCGYGNEFYEELKRRAPEDRPKNQTFIVSKRDPYASYEAAEEVAHLLKAPVIRCDKNADLKKNPDSIRCDARHFPLHEYQEALERFTKRILATAAIPASAAPDLAA